MAEKTKEREFDPGVEPVQEYVAEEEDISKVNPATGIPYHKVTQDSVNQAVYAMASGDFGSARRALFGDADEGIHHRLPDEVANPVPDPKALEKQAKEVRQIREKQAEMEAELRELSEKAGGSTAVKDDRSEEA